MLAAKLYSNFCADFFPPGPELLQIHRSRISLHYARAGYCYPTVRLPHYLSSLAGLSARIYQTVHDGTLAFLVVISSTRKAAKQSVQESEQSQNTRKIPRLDMAEVADIH
jgi:hypothetical protein